MAAMTEKIQAFPSWHSRLTASLLNYFFRYQAAHGCCAGVGVKKALELVKKYRNLARVLQVLRLSPKMQVPPEYPEAAQRALWNFRHALVFDAAAGEADVDCLHDQAINLPCLQALTESTGRAPALESTCKIIAVIGSSS